jgi:hypothetical protein
VTILFAYDGSESADAAIAAAALLPNAQVLYAGGGKVKDCGQYSCEEPVADAELYTP